jgi:hypothetical protein
MHADTLVPAFCCCCRLQVSSPQLSLLEATLASMTRVDAFIMMRQQRSPGNVFEEAAR